MKQFPLSLLLGSLPWLVGCTQAPATQTTRDRPAIDQAAPQKLETATFALG